MLLVFDLLAQPLYEPCTGVRYQGCTARLYCTYVGTCVPKCMHAGRGLQSSPGFNDGILVMYYVSHVCAELSHPQRSQRHVPRGWGWWSDTHMRPLPTYQARLNSRQKSYLYIALWNERISHQRQIQPKFNHLTMPQSQSSLQSNHHAATQSLSPNPSSSVSQQTAPAISNTTRGNDLWTKAYQKLPDELKQQLSANNWGAAHKLQTLQDVLQTVVQAKDTAMAKRLHFK